MKVFGYDVEIFPNCFTMAVVDLEDYVRKCHNIEDLPYAEQLKIYDSVNTKVFIVYEEQNDIPALLSFINREQYLVGFNSGRYDDTILKYIMMNLSFVKSTKTITSKLYEFNKEIINSQNSNSKFNYRVYKVTKCNTIFTGIDLMSVFGLNKSYKSLKQTCINIKWHNLLDYKMPPPREEEYELYKFDDPNELEDWDRYVMPYHLEGICSYNINDSMATCEIFRKKIKDIVLRINISNKYKVDVISSSESDIADKIFTKLYCDKSGLTEEEYNSGYTLRENVKIKECIPDTIRFETPELKKLYSDLSNAVIVNTKGDLNFEVEFDGNTYNIATGGLHSKDTPDVLISDDKFEYTDGDAAAYYPWNVIHHGIHPEHLDQEVFLDTVLGVVMDRADAKPSGKHPDKVTDKTLKVVINSGIFGKMGFAIFDEYGNIEIHSPLYDPKALVSVTISGQLYLLMLIERLSLGGFKCVSANTDGIIVKVERSRYDEYYSICQKWEKDTHFELEYTYYSKYIRRDINNYFSIKKNDIDIDTIKDNPVERKKFRDKYVKFKGDFNPNLYLEDLRKGFNKPIVAIAVADYFIFGVDPMVSIKQSRDIYDFCMTQNINKSFSLIGKTVQDGKPTNIKYQRNSRWYVSNRGVYLYKIHNDTKKLTGIIKGFPITVMNRYVEHDDMKKYDIRYSYYYAEAMAIINRIKIGNTSAIKKRTKPGNKAKKKLNPLAKGFGQVGTLFD